MRRALLSAVVSVLAVALTAGPSSAQTKVRDDPRGDALRTDDVTSVRVRDGRTSYVLSVRFARVVRRHTAVTVDLGREGDVSDLRIESIPVSGGRYVTRLVDTGDGAGSAGPARLDCPGLRGTWDRGRNGRARIVVPQRCLGGEPGRRVGAGVRGADKQVGVLPPRGEPSHRDVDVSDPRAFDDVSGITTRRA
ncbi:hypothetical protein [Solicola sp. PLA-1-18]|uniref:hypothetical protein n=1 Tax=Solicola sp. PLA-1-18 TaxID=3380532 RepID=UPI003B7BDACF